MTASTTLAAVSNRLWRLGALRGHRRFVRALEHPAEAQLQLLRRTLTDNARTAYGRAHGFSDILRRPDPWTAFQEQVPPVTWDDLEPWIDRARRGEPGVLTAEPVDRLVPSSGSTAACKLVPYTPTLRAQFRRALDPWIVDLFERHPEALDGPSYWSVSPGLNPETRPGDAVPVGFDDDAEYLGPVARRWARATQAVPGDVSQIRDLETFRYVTLLHLLATRDLALVSVWHPSFWTLLLETVPRFRRRLVRDLAHGTLTPPASLPASLQQRLTQGLSPDPERARRAREATRRDPLRASSLWPRLALLSAWGDGPAAGPFESLARLHPEVPRQAKGLFATEAFVTLPFRGTYPLAVTSHVFELVDDAGRAHALGPEIPLGTYTVLVTTGSGLYRYRLEDRVRVEGHLGATPTARFLGKEDHVSDRVGEKLSEGFVSRVLTELALANARFALLAPEPLGDERWGYVLYVAAETLAPDLDRALDSTLSENPHYRWARRLGQLAPARVVPVAEDAPAIYLERQTGQGRRLGDVKPAVLSRESGWRERFSKQP